MSLFWLLFSRLLWRFGWLLCCVVCIGHQFVHFYLFLILTAFGRYLFIITIFKIFQETAFAFLGCQYLILRFPGIQYLLFGYLDRLNNYLELHFSNSRSGLNIALVQNWLTTMEERYACSNFYDTRNNRFLENFCKKSTFSIPRSLYGVSLYLLRGKTK